jgi:hypothetical protein
MALLSLFFREILGMDKVSLCDPGARLNLKPFTFSPSVLLEAQANVFNI